MTGTTVINTISIKCVFCIKQGLKMCIMHLLLLLLLLCASYINAFFFFFFINCDRSAVYPVILIDFLMFSIFLTAESNVIFFSFSDDHLVFDLLTYVYLLDTYRFWISSIWLHRYLLKWYLSCVIKIWLYLV